MSVNEPYFAGHFPGTPIMPGVLLIESAAQLCSLVFAPESVEEDKLYVLLKVKNFKMLRPVIPGDTLIISVNVTMSTKSAFEFACVIKVDGEVRAKGNLCLPQWIKMRFTSRHRSDYEGSRIKR